MSAEVLDLTTQRLASENEIDNAIYAVLCAAFGEHDEEPQVRKGVRSRLPRDPSPLQVVEAACAELRSRGRLRHEEQRRGAAAQVLAAFLDLSPEDRADVSLGPPPQR
jgi:hypothetical protein